MADIIMPTGIDLTYGGIFYVGRHTQEMTE